MQACLLLYVTLCDHCEIKMNGDSSSSKVHKLPLQHLKQITNNFSDKLVLGTGGFGVVYKGVQPNGRIVAVKKLLHSKPSSLEQFENEVDLLMRLEHPNIVRLVGYCYEIQNEHVPYNGKYVFAGETESLLCLEYLPNGSLDRFLSDPDEFSRFDWHTCYQIIEGTCNGLQYLHEQTNGPIIHLDLKPANILLSDVLVPKITDFGLSRLLDREQTICTMMVTGTLGYMPSEYLQGILTPMSDIFSLGVIILEIVTGERKYPDDISTSSEEFVELELKKWRNALQKKPGYTSLEIDCHQVKRCIQIGLACMNPLRAKRPTITQIIKMLQALEGTDCNISNEVISPAAQVRPGPRELLDIYPEELTFSLQPDKRICCIVKLTNKTDECIAFHFKVTLAANMYHIEPAGGFLWPGSMLLPSELERSDEFLVQSIIVREDKVTSKNIPEHTFNKMSSYAVHKVKLSVIRLPPVQVTTVAQHFEGSQVVKAHPLVADLEETEPEEDIREVFSEAVQVEDSIPEVDKDADDFTKKFHQQMRLQRLDSFMRYRDRLRHHSRTLVTDPEDTESEEEHTLETEEEEKDKRRRSTRASTTSAGQSSYRSALSQNQVHMGSRTEDLLSKKRRTEDL